QLLVLTGTSENLLPSGAPPTTLKILPSAGGPSGHEPGRRRTPMRPHPRSFASFAAALALAIVAAPAAAQIPDKFTNLKVLPKDISKDDLISTMRGFSGGLGVRCNFCHVGGTETDLTGMKFASDDKKEKKI